ncbi:MAG: hypothetical protein KAT16_03655 [Candidatus Heimdallarchaeota archaeon]|nr:hypothetical protein [Candidatus Heimdallarchaeota archaeon]
MKKVENMKKPFYMVSIDILKGLAIFPMVIGHSLQWWDFSLVMNYADSHIIITLLVSIGLMVFPLFLFIYGFNQTNSFLRRKLNNQQEVRIRAMKRAFMLILFATFAQAIMTFIRSPDEWIKLPNYIFSWHLFHLFAFSTISLLIMWEITIWISKKYDTRSIRVERVYLSILIGISTFVLLLYFFFHEYTMGQPVTFPVELDIISILGHALLDVGSAGVIPWILFSLAGGITASLLDLSHSEIKTARKNVIFLLVGFLLVLIMGILSLSIEPFVSPALRSPSTYSHVFISIGAIGSLAMLLFLIFDLNGDTRQKNIRNLFSPVIIISKITLTIFIIHPVVFALDPKTIPSLEIAFVLATLYSLMFIPIAYIWQKYDFRYSFEWFIQGKSRKK